MPRTANTPYPHTCPTCGTVFLHGSSRRRYCSKPCAVVAKTLRRRLGRRRGEAHHSAKLTEQQVRQLRQEYEAGGMSTHDLAARFGVRQSTVWAIVRRKHWAHVA